MMWKSKNSNNKNGGLCSFLSIWLQCILIMGHLMQNLLLHALFEHKCVGSVCTHSPYNDKNPPSFFFIPNNNDHLLRSSCSQILGRVT